MIKIDNLVKNYGEFTAVNNLSIRIKKGEIFALLGLNGAGKSTTIKVICGLTQKDAGRIFVDGLDLDVDENKIKQIVNLSPQETAIAPNLTVEENLDFISSLYGINESQNAVNRAIERFSLENKRKSRAKTLSGGQKRRLSIAMAMITNPKVLILDEPTLGLDVKARKVLWDLIKECKGERTVLLTTHYLEEAENLADRIAIMNKGKLVALGSADEIINQSGKKDFEGALLTLAGGEDE